MDGGLGGLELGPDGVVLGLVQGDLALGLGVFLLQAGEVVGLAEGVGAEGAKGGGERFAVFSVALLMGEESSGQQDCYGWMKGGRRWHVTAQKEGQGMEEEGEGGHTSRLRIRSFTTLMILPMVSARS